LPIRPIDIVKSHDASQYKQIQNQRVQHEQVHINKNFQELVQAETSRPTGATKSENNEFRYDAKEEGRNTYNGSSKRQKRDRDKQKDDKGPHNKGSGGSGGIDILV